MSTILVIDDSNFSRKQVTRALPEEHTILQAVNGKEGLEMAIAEKPDCVFTDMLMPVMDGMEFLAELRKQDGDLGQTPVVVVSADIQSSTQEICNGLGIVGFINKPFKRDAIVDILEQALQQAA